MKICTKCKEEKPVSEFRNYPSYQSGACKQCEREYHTDYLRRTREEVTLYKRESLLLEGLGYCGRCELTLPLDHFNKTSRTTIGYHGTCKDCKALLQRASRVKRFYGISYEEYSQMLLEQDDSCAICKSSFTEKVCVDHDHSTGDVRGLLCDSCNRGVGLLKDDPVILQSALDYLNKAGPCKIPLNGEPPEVDNTVLNLPVMEENA